MHQNKTPISKNLVDSVVYTIMGPDRNNSNLWWSTPNQRFGGRTPDEQWEIESVVVVDHVIKDMFKTFVESSK